MPIYVIKQGDPPPKGSWKLYDQPLAQSSKPHDHPLSAPVHPTPPPILFDQSLKRLNNPQTSTRWRIKLFQSPINHEETAKFIGGLPQFNMNSKKDFRSKFLTRWYDGNALLTHTADWSKLVWEVRQYKYSFTLIFAILLKLVQLSSIFSVNYICHQKFITKSFFYLPSLFSPVSVLLGNGRNQPNVE